MKRFLLISVASFALVSAGWMVVSGLLSSSHEGDPAIFHSVAAPKHSQWVAGAEQANNPKESSFPSTNDSRSTLLRRSFRPANHDSRNTVPTDRTHSVFSVASSTSRKKMNPSKISTDTIPVDSTESPEADKVPDAQVINTYHAPQPAVWVDVGEASSLTQTQQDEIQIMAESLSQKITQSGLIPTSPEYRRMWEQAVADSDQLFRQRYGDQAWLQHHIQAYHLARSTIVQELETSVSEGR